MDPLDDKAACLDLAQKIEADVVKARSHRIFNTCLQTLVGLMVTLNFSRSFLIVRSIRENMELTKRSMEGTLAVQVRQDLYRQQYLDYIKDSIDFMQELQDQNKSLKVPKAPVPRPLVRPAEGDATEESLRRIPQTAPGPTPSPQIKTIVKVKRLRAPTPKPIKWPWSKTTR
jgi:hypothetical protein